MQIFHRRALAEQMAGQIMNPTGFNVSILSGIFLSGIRRTGKTTFIKHDLMPALEALGAVVIYVDLWADTSIAPIQHVNSALRQKLVELTTAGSKTISMLSRLRGLEIEVPGFKFGFSVESVGEAGGPTIAQALTEVVAQAKTNVVLIVDEVQQAMMTPEGNALMLAIKAARDAINLDPDSEGKFIFLGTGSHRAMLHEMTTRRQQAFQGAHMQEYQTLGRDFIQHQLGLLRAHESVLPSEDVTFECFQQLMFRPEMLMNVLRHVSSMRPSVDGVDELMRLGTKMQRDHMVEQEMSRLDQLPPLAQQVFRQIVSLGDEARGLFSADALAIYANQLGRPVRTEEVQAAISDLLANNLIRRKAHGIYALSDADFAELWLENMRRHSADC